RIGWVRGTGLMDANNPLAARLEDTGNIRTFSAEEMGLLLTALCTEPFRDAAATRPVQADLTAGFDGIEDLRGTVERIRQALDAEVSASRKRQELEQQFQRRVATGNDATLNGDAAAHSVVKPLPGWPRNTIEG